MSQLKPDFESLREKAVALAHRAEVDEHFKERLRKEPEIALEEFGLTLECATLLFREIGLESDVCGYELPDADCIPRCVITTWPLS